MKISAKSLASLLLVILVLSVHSCKKLQPFSPSGSTVVSNATLTAISHLPSGERVTGQEMKVWFASIGSSTGLQPEWEKGMQFIANGRQVIEIPTSADAALFFTKTKGVLKVEAFKWLVKTHGARTYTGNIIYYSFAENKLHALVYEKGKLIKNGVFDAPSSSSPDTNTPLINPEPATSPAFTTITRSGGYTVLDWLACIFGGGTWIGFETGCNYNQTSWWGDVLNFFGGMFTGGGTGGSDLPDEESEGGGSFTGSDGTTIVVTNASDGQSTWMTVNSPCSPIDGGGSDLGGGGDGGLASVGGPCDNSSTDLVYIPDIYNASDTYTGDEPDEPDDDNNSYTGPTEHIPSQIILNNGQVVQVEFGTTTSDNKSADNPVSVKLVNLLTAALNAASQHTTIYRIYIAATTNGQHINKPPLHVSNHYSGLAIDLSRINGVPLALQGPSDVVKQLQLALDQNPDIRENFGPYFKHKYGQPFNTTDGSDHIHFSTNP